MKSEKIMEKNLRLVGVKIVDLRLGMHVLSYSIRCEGNAISFHILLIVNITVIDYCLQKSFTLSLIIDFY